MVESTEVGLIQPYFSVYRYWFGVKIYTKLSVFFFLRALIIETKYYKTKGQQQLNLYRIFLQTSWASSTHRQRLSSQCIRIHHQGCHLQDHQRAQFQLRAKRLQPPWSARIICTCKTVKRRGVKSSIENELRSMHPVDDIGRRFCNHRGLILTLAAEYAYVTQHCFFTMKTLIHPSTITFFVELFMKVVYSGNKGNLSRWWDCLCRMYCEATMTIVSAVNTCDFKLTTKERKNQYLHQKTWHICRVKKHILSTAL